MAPRYTVYITPAINGHLGPIVEEPIYAESDELAVAELRERFRATVGERRLPEDIVIIRGPDSDTVAHTATIAELRR